MSLKLVIMDMDGTIVQYADGHYQSSWDALGRAAGKWGEWQELARFYFSRPELYHEWSARNCALLRGISLDAVVSEIFPPPYTKGFQEFCAHVRSLGIPQGIVSGGVGFIGRKIQEDAGLDFVVANEVDISKGYFTGQGKVYVHMEDKGRVVRTLMQRYGVQPFEAAFIGDHVNDISAWREVYHALGMNVKDPRCHPWIKKSFPHFTALLEAFPQLNR